MQAEGDVDLIITCSADLPEHSEMIAWYSLQATALAYVP